MDEPRLYTDLADWWTLLSPPYEYEEEAAFYLRLMQEASRRPLRHVLELGSGGGNNASHLKSHFTMTLVDRSAGMLAESRRLNPECEHIEGDMRSVRLGRRFDAVFVHDAVVYMTTEADLTAAIATAFLHCEPGGVALFAPDHVRETYSPSTDCGGYDGARRGLRYLEWSWDPDPADTQCVTDYVYALRGEDGSVKVVHDRHIEGLFGQDQSLQWLSDAGFQANMVPLEHSDVPTGSCVVFVAVKP